MSNLNIILTSTDSCACNDDRGTRRRRCAVRVAGQLVPDARRRQRWLQQDRPGRKQLLPIQADARQSTGGRPQARVRRAGCVPAVSGRGADVPSADAAHQDKNGRDRHHHRHIQVRVRSAGQAAREQPHVRSGLVVAAGRLVRVSCAIANSDEGIRRPPLVGTSNLGTVISQ